MCVCAVWIEIASSFSLSEIKTFSLSLFPLLKLMCYITLHNFFSLGFSDAFLSILGNLIAFFRFSVVIESKVLKLHVVNCKSAPFSIARKEIPLKMMLTK